MGNRQLIWLWFAVLWLAAPSYGQAPNVTAGKVLPIAVKATPLFDGLLREGMPGVVRIQVINRGPDLNGELVLEQQTMQGTNVVWTRDIELPENGRKEWSFVYGPNWGTEQQMRLRGLVEPFDIAFKVRPHGPGDVLIGVVGLDAHGINSIGETFGGRVPAARPLEVSYSSQVEAVRTVRVGLTELAALPNRSEGYRLLNWLVWPNADPSSLTPEQIDAIVAWVADGGHLFVTVSDSYRQVMNSPLAEALPVRLTGLSDVAKIRGFTRAVASGASGVAAIPVATAVPKQTGDVWTLATLADDKPIWVAGSYGLGTVHVVPMDLRNQIVQDEVDLTQMWRRLLWLPPKGSGASWFGYTGNLNPDVAATSPRRVSHAIPPLALVSALNIAEPNSATEPDYLVASQQTDLIYAISEYLADIPGVAPLPLSWLLAFAMAYLFFIGPFDYFLLKRLGKQPWTWVTFPFYIALFSAMAMVGTSLAKGSQAVIKRLDVVDVLPGGDWVRGTSMLGVFATGRARVALIPGFQRGFAEPSVSDGGFMERVTMRQSMGPRQMQWSTQTWTLAFAQTQWIEPMPELGLRVEHKDEEVHIQNGSTLNLSRCVVIFGEQKWEIGSVDAGATVDKGWSFTLASEWMGSAAYYDADQVEEWALTAMAEFQMDGRGAVNMAHRATLVCLADASVEPLQIKGLSGQENTVTVIRVPFALNPRYQE